MKHDALTGTLQQLGFTQYEAQCYIGLLRQHPINASQLSTVCGVPRAMIYQTLNRLEEKGIVVRLIGKEGEPHLYEPVPPKQVIGQLSLRFQSSCEQAEAELASISSGSTADVLVTLVDPEEILRRALFLVRQAQHSLSIFGEAQELTALAGEVNDAVMRAVAVRVVSFGSPPPLSGKVVTYLGKNVSYPTRFLLVVADQAQLLIATYPSNAAATAYWTQNAMLALLASAFINLEYYFIRMSNEHPAVLQRVLWQVVEPEDVERYAHHLDFLEQRLSDQQHNEGNSYEQHHV
jgi:HTH-type transcriptional regulator, sugar sensing transcriptional regulator